MPSHDCSAEGTDAPLPHDSCTRATRTHTIAGYLNEIGEAFRPLIPVEIVYLR